MAKNPYIAVIYYPTLIDQIKCFSLGECPAAGIQHSVANCMQLALVWFSTMRYETAAMC